MPVAMGASGRAAAGISPLTCPQERLISYIEDRVSGSREEVMVMKVERLKYLPFLFAVPLVLFLCSPGFARQSFEGYSRPSASSGGGQRYHSPGRSGAVHYGNHRPQQYRQQQYRPQQYRSVQQRPQQWSSRGRQYDSRRYVGQPTDRRYLGRQYDNRRYSGRDYRDRNYQRYYDNRRYYRDYDNRYYRHQYRPYYSYPYGPYYRYGRSYYNYYSYGFPYFYGAPYYYGYGSPYYSYSYSSCYSWPCYGLFPVLPFFPWFSFYFSF